MPASTSNRGAAPSHGLSPSMCQPHWASGCFDTRKPCERMSKRDVAGERPAPRPPTYRHLQLMPWPCSMPRGPTAPHLSTHTPHSSLGILSCPFVSGAPFAILQRIHLDPSLTPLSSLSQAILGPASRTPHSGDHPVMHLALLSLRPCPPTASVRLQCVGLPMGLHSLRAAPLLAGRSLNQEQPWYLLPPPPTTRLSGEEGVRARVGVRQQSSWLCSPGTSTIAAGPQEVAGTLQGESGTCRRAGGPRGI